MIKQRVLIHRSANELEHLFIKGKYSLANEKIPLISKGINDFEYPIEPYYKIQLTYLFAMVAVSVGDYRKALDYTNTILNEYHTSDNQNTFLLTQILNIFIHFDLENYILNGQLFQYDIASRTHYMDDVVRQVEYDKYDIVMSPDDLGGKGENIAYIVVNTKILQNLS